MRTKVCLVLIVCSSLTVWAADNIKALNAKEGLWEITASHSASGMPATANIPPDALAKMTPEQRARVDALMAGKPDVHKECITKEKLEKNSAFAPNRGECSYNVVNSTGRKMEVKFHCQDKQSSTDGTYVMEAIDPDNVKGTIHMVSNSSGDHTTTMDFTISSKYLGPACGDVK